MIDKARKLKVVANFGVGYDNIDWKYCTEKQIFVVNTLTTVTEPTAELAFAIMLAITNGLASSFSYCNTLMILKKKINKKN